MAQYQSEWLSGAFIFRGAHLLQKPAGSARPEPAHGVAVLNPGDAVLLTENGQLSGNERLRAVFLNNLTDFSEDLPAAAAQADLYLPWYQLERQVRKANPDVVEPAMMVYTRRNVLAPSFEGSHLLKLASQVLTHGVGRELVWVNVHPHDRVIEREIPVRDQVIEAVIRSFVTHAREHADITAEQCAESISDMLPEELGTLEQRAKMLMSILPANGESLSMLHAVRAIAKHLPPSLAVPEPEPAKSQAEEPQRQIMENKRAPR